MSSEVPFTEKVAGRGPQAEGASWHEGGEEGVLKMAELALGSGDALFGGDGPAPLSHPTKSLIILRRVLRTSFIHSFIHLLSTGDPTGPKHPLCCSQPSGGV